MGLTNCRDNDVLSPSLDEHRSLWTALVGAPIAPSPRRRGVRGGRSDHAVPPCVVFRRVAGGASLERSNGNLLDHSDKAEVVGRERRATHLHGPADRAELRPDSKAPAPLERWQNATSPTWPRHKRAPVLLTVAFGDPGGIRTHDLDLERVACWASAPQGRISQANDLRTNDPSRL
jgi:hypothetical protein